MEDWSSLCFQYESPKTNNIMNDQWQHDNVNEGWKILILNTSSMCRKWPSIMKADYNEQCKILVLHKCAPKLFSIDHESLFGFNIELVIVNLLK